MEGSVRNLEQIQESDSENRMPTSAKVIIVSLGIACIGFAVVALSGKKSAQDGKRVDPLGELADKTQKAGNSGPMKRASDLSTSDVTFPSLLSDDSHPTTALAAVKGNAPVVAIASAGPVLVPVVPLNANAPLVVTNNNAPASSAIASNANGTPNATGNPPPATDRLPVVPLPAQNVLEATPIITHPRDTLTKAATTVAESAASNAELAPSGHEGGYQLQVSSFRTQTEADQFATELRARSHKAYVVEAHVPGRGTWFRVRIGPFPNQHSAASYRVGFEGREHVVPFIVPPQTAKGEHGDSHGDH